MVQSQFFHFAELMNDDLPRLCREKRTGMLFIASSDHRLAQFGLDQGEIVFLVFQNKRGLEALSLLKGQDFKVGVCRFFEGQASPSRLVLPSTEDILRQLASEAPRPTATDPVSGRIRPTATDPVSGRIQPTATDPVSGRIQPTATDPVSGRMLTDPIKTVLQQELAEFI